MINDRYRIVLASNSPRRKELLAGLGIDFDVRTIADIDESYPQELPLQEIAEDISAKKAAAYRATMNDGELVITADTVVICGDEVMGKPVDGADAQRMLRKLSGRSHSVTTDEEILYYIKEYRPFDKAGAYGIQEWIGYIGCTGLNGSYYNVMGLPVQRIYQELREM